MEPKNAILMKDNSGFVYWDPKLTKKGEQQCHNLKATIRGSSVWGFNKPLNLDLVVVSPTTRTLQTAFLSLGTPDTAGAPPFIATELCREHISEAMCDGRSSITHFRKKFPGVDFSLVADDQDTMFLTKETEEHVEERGREFLKWLCGRPETHIAVVTHSIFLKTLLKQFAAEISEKDREEIHQSWVNAEMRSIMLCAHKKFPSSISPEEAEVMIRKKAGRSVWNVGQGGFDMTRTKSGY
jgi:broad specificity phosphatase PhoE